MIYRTAAYGSRVSGERILRERTRSEQLGTFNLIVRKRNNTGQASLCIFQL